MNDTTPPFIRLDDALKLRGDVSTGGRAKAMIQAGEAKVNGETEIRRGKKLHAGDKVTIGAVSFVVDETLLTRSTEAEGDHAD